VSQSLYRKYRSRGFDEIVGQSHVTDLLKNAIERGTFAHAYLFTGPRGTGKTSVARILAHAINKLPYTDDSTHLDIIEIDAASNRRIDDIRDLREKVHIAPSSADYKVYIIDEVHMLTGESFNALLKTLEEPPAHAVFILATTELHKVPATIISRTQRFHFRPGSIKDIVGHLSSIAKQEKINIDDDALALIARHSEGGFRDSVSLLDQVSSLSESSISRSDVESLLGLAPSQTIEEIIAASLQGQRDDAVKQIVKLIDDGIHPASITSQLLISASDQASKYPRLYELMQQLLEISRSHAPDMKLIATIATFADTGVKQTTTSPNKPSKPAVAVAKTDVVALVAVTPMEPAKPKVAPTPVTKSFVKPAAASQDKPVIVFAEGRIEGFDWNNILNELKKDAPALYSVVKNAITDYDGENLTIQTQFALHKKKIESEKYTKQLVDCITMQYQACPRIVVTEVEKPTLDSVGTQVADIMGGGEAV
jgi:DNA polymerase-3 subunit gamma/tau